MNGLTPSQWVMCKVVITNRLVCGVWLYVQQRAKAHGVGSSTTCGLLCPASGRCQKSPEIMTLTNF